MTKTKTTAPRVRQTNLYTVELDGQPVAQAMAISQAEAVRLYVESVRQPAMTARLSSLLEARTLAGLPLLQREPAAVDTRTANLFEATPAADHVEGILTMVEPLAAGGFAPCGRALGDCGKATQTCGRGGCSVELAPIAAGLPAEFLSYIEGEEPAAAQPGEPVAGDCAEPASAPADASPASADAPRRRLFDEAPKGAGKVVAKYRNPDDGSTWSGRGLTPRWLMKAIDDGKTLDDFLI